MSRKSLKDFTITDRGFNKSGVMQTRYALDPIGVEYSGCEIYDWTGDVPIERAAWEQIDRVSRLPFVNKIAVMPDAHVGMGATIGTVMHTTGAIIPAAVGVDIGCGILAYRTNLLRDDIRGFEESIRTIIQAGIPNGRTDNGGAGDIGKWGTNHKRHTLVEYCLPELMEDYNELTIHNGHLSGLRHQYVMDHLGTLGTGNHFIEIAEDEVGILWILVHSGSRGPGARIANHFMKLAKELCAAYFVKLEDPDLAFIPTETEHFREYWAHTKWAQRYAVVSRTIMATLAAELIGGCIDEPVIFTTQVDTSHNYIEKARYMGQDGYITRKGASQAVADKLSVMPGSMGTSSYIVEGKSNVLSLNSCSHGAGRAMSRTQALKTFDTATHAEATQGVFCRKDEGVVDETPGAYKDIDLVLAQQSDLVSVKHKLKAVINVKG